MEIGLVKPVKIEEEMKSAYLDYAMSVIVSRALPDVRDGLKPVQRRILFAMDELNLRHNSAYKKCARIVGEVLGKYHPHGDSAVYEALVRLAQDFSMRYPLVDGQGNFGSVDNDPPAAMRYTEARLAEIAHEMLVDIEKETVDFIPNFDNSLKEPSILPSRIPNLLLNGSSGIAVGMATNIPPHNLNEVCDAIIVMIDNPDVSSERLMEIVKGPDFPTGGIIQGTEGINKAYTTGQGKIVVQAKHFIEDTRTGRKQIIVSELPYQVNKAALLEKIAELIKEKKVDGISDLRDESDREGMRMVLELRKDAQVDKIMNNLYKYTSMRSAFFVNAIALVDGQPRLLSLRELLQHYVDFRHQIIVRRSRYELQQAKNRAHILEGLKIALDNLDEVIKTIRQSENVESARKALEEKFKLTTIQAQAILDMQLRRLAALERQKIIDEYTQLLKDIAYYEDLLANPKKIYFLIKDDMTEIKKKYGDPRRTAISAEEARVYQDEDLIPHLQMVVTLSSRGYIKRLPIETYRAQKRGGRGAMGVPTKDVDAVRLLFVADTHDNLLFFTNKGKVYHLKCYELPSEATRAAKGIPLINLIMMDNKEQVTAVVNFPAFAPDYFMVMINRSGETKRTRLSEFAAVRSNGLIATNLKAHDELVDVKLAKPDDEVIAVSQNGRASRFSVNDLRIASRRSGGVRGMRVEPGNQVVSLDVLRPNAHLLVVTEFGFGKLTMLDLFALHRRGTKGILAQKITQKTGKIADAKLIGLEDDVMIISQAGVVIRLSVKEVSMRSRNTQGVHLMKLDSGDRVVAIASIGNESQGVSGK